MEDHFNLKRFVDAQQSQINSILAELKQGQKTGHWMWFVFPQLKGLGRSSTAIYYALSSRAEADAYLRHPTLGPRLIECTELVNKIAGRSIIQIFGDVDAVKFRSSMTLFANADPTESTFSAALDKYFAREPDPLTLEILQKSQYG